MSTPGIGFPKPSVTWTMSGSGRTAPTGALCPSPETAASPFASAETAVSDTGADRVREPLATLTSTSAETLPTRVPMVT